MCDESAHHIPSLKVTNVVAEALGRAQSEVRAAPAARPVMEPRGGARAAARAAERRSHPPIPPSFRSPLFAPSPLQHTFRRDESNSNTAIPTADSTTVPLPPLLCPLPPSRAPLPAPLNLHPLLLLRHSNPPFLQHPPHLLTVMLIEHAPSDSTLASLLVGIGVGLLFSVGSYVYLTSSFGLHLTALSALSPSLLVVPILLLAMAFVLYVLCFATYSEHKLSTEVRSHA